MVELGTLVRYNFRNYVRERLMAKRGPKTVVGKAAVRSNAVQHGIYAQAPVVAGLESEDEWLGHLRGTLDSLKPQGHLESELAERSRFCSGVSAGWQDTNGKRSRSARRR